MKSNGAAINFTLQRLANFPDAENGELCIIYGNADIASGIYCYYDTITGWKLIHPVEASPNTILSLSDVGVQAVANGYLQWDAQANKVEFVTAIPASAITGLATVATSGDYEDLQNKYTLPSATQSELGGVKVGTGLSVDNEGQLTVSMDGGAF